MKLPKSLKDHPLENTISKWLTSNLQLIRSEGKVSVAALPWNEKVESALRQVLLDGHLQQGLDQIERDMRKELHGLQQVAKKSDAEVPARLSRLLVMASDGSERFYHNAESLLLQHKERMSGCILSADSVALGKALSKKNQPLKALLINDRKALEAFLIQVFEK